jgi:hypothetical protein
MSNPHIATTEQLLERLNRLPELGPEVANQLHPNALHLVFPMSTYDEVDVGFSATPCSVVAVTRAGSTLRFAHFFDEAQLDRMGSMESLLTRYADLSTLLVEHSTVSDIEAYLAQVQGVQERLPFDAGD